MGKLFIIWSIEHSAWWAPYRVGYVKERSKAGTYTYDEACKIVNDANFVTTDVPNEAMMEYPGPCCEKCYYAPVDRVGEFCKECNPF